MSTPSAPDAAAATAAPTSGTEPSPSATTAGSEATTEKPTTAGPRATRVVEIHTKRGPVTFAARSKDSPAGSPSPAPTASASAETGQPPAAVAPPSGTKPTEPPKPTEPAPHRALTIALEKEAKLVEAQRQFKAEREAFEASRKATDADLALLQQARELVKGGKRLKAMELLGVSLDDVQDEFLASVKEETPEDKAARIVRDTLAKEREAVAQQAREAEEKAAKERTAAEETRVSWWCDQVQAAFKARAAEFDPAAFEGVTAAQVWQRACAECNATGKLPTSSEALDLIQKDFDARLTRSARYKPVAAQAAPATPEKPQDSPSVKAKDTPRTLTTRGAGSVPVVAAKPRDTKKSALERAREAARDLGVAID